MFSRFSRVIIRVIGRCTVGDGEWLLLSLSVGPPMNWQLVLGLRLERA